MVDSRRVTVARARPIASRSRAKPSMSAPIAAGGEQGERPGAAPVRELAQVQGVRLAGQAAVTGQEPGEGESLGIGEGRLDRGECGGWGGSGHRAPPGRAETREAGPVAGPSDKAE